MSMRDLARNTAKEVDQQLAETELRLLMDSDLQNKNISPELKSHQLYSELISAIGQSSQSNRDVAQLKQRLEGLGNEGWALAQKLIKLVK